MALDRGGIRFTAVRIPEKAPKLTPVGKPSGTNSPPPVRAEKVSKTVNGGRVLLAATMPLAVALDAFRDDSWGTFKLPITTLTALALAAATNMKTNTSNIARIRSITHLLQALALTVLIV